jgi:superfamily II DNA/RNA helicase
MILLFLVQRFASGILVSFGLSARGLDIKGLRTVVNFDCARDIDSHTHRIGRTGRAGLSVSQSDYQCIDSI